MIGKRARGARQKDGGCILTSSNIPSGREGGLSSHSAEFGRGKKKKEGPLDSNGGRRQEAYVLIFSTRMEGKKTRGYKKKKREVARAFCSLNFQKSREANHFRLFKIAQTTNLLSTKRDKKERGEVQ